jgi:hypothetical protein
MSEEDAAILAYFDVSSSCGQSLRWNVLRDFIHLSEASDKIERRPTFGSPCRARRNSPPVCRTSPEAALGFGNTGLFIDSRSFGNPAAT